MNVSRVPSTKKFQTIVAAIAILLSPAVGLDHSRSFDGGKMQTAFGSTSSSQSQSSLSPHCETVGKKEIKITCHYAASAVTTSSSLGQPRIVLNDAVLSFEIGNDSYMHAELSFTNEGRSPVYLEIDDDSNRNYVRRLLPHVDFRTLDPAIKHSFTEHLLIPALRPRHYSIRLWIPHPDPSLKFDPAHDLLLSSVGVPDQENGLNLVATFAVVR
jgi:hypothetical protein